MSEPKSPDSSHNPVLSTFKQAGRTYEQRLTDCGKPNCLRCGGSGPRVASHGPYWYLCVLMNHHWVRIYLGRELDTKRYIAPDGQIDWEALKIWRARKITTIAHRPQKNRMERPFGEETSLPDDSPSPPNPLVP
jgi:hypothetical protein